MTHTALLIATVASLYLPLQAQANACTQDQIHAGCHTDNTSGQCRKQGIVFEGPCRALEEAPLTEYDCVLQVRERVLPGGGWRAVKGPFTITTKDYDPGFTGKRLHLYKQVQIDRNVRSFVDNLIRECPNYEPHKGCEVECLRR